MADKAKGKQSKKDADRLRLTKMVQDLPLAGVNLKTGEIGLRELSEKVRDSDSYGTPLSKGAISAGFKKIKDMPFLKRMEAMHGKNKTLDRETAQAAREAGAEERREARGMKKGGSVSPSKKVLSKSGFYDKGKTKSEREKIVSKVTTKPQRVKMVEKMLSASKRGDGIAIRGKTKGRMV